MKQLFPSPRRTGKQQKLATLEKSTPQKIAILGASGGGKSTISTHFRLKYHSGPNWLAAEEEVVHYKSEVARIFFEFTFEVYQWFGTTEDETLDMLLSQGKSIWYKESELISERVTYIRQLWNSENGRQVWNERKQHALPDVLEYLCQEETLQRMNKAEYVISNEDAVRRRLWDHRNRETNLKVKGKDITFVDGIARRKRRRAWFHEFDDVSAIFFVMALDNIINISFFARNISTEDSRLLAQTIKIGDQRNVPIVILFTKIDLFQDELLELEASGESLDEYFPDLALGTNYKDALPQLLEFIEIQVRNKLPEGRSSMTCFLNGIDLKTTPQLLEGCLEWLQNIGEK